MEDVDSIKKRYNARLDMLSNLSLANDSNYKFMVILRTRLTEEGLPLDMASKIATIADFDMSHFNEDDDYIGDVALRYAEFCAKVYNELVSCRLDKYLDDAMIVRLFNPLGRFQ